MASPHRLPTRNPRVARRLAGLATAAGLTVGALFGSASPAGAIPPAGPDIVGNAGYDQNGPTGYHQITWRAPFDSGGKSILEYQVEQWNADLSLHYQTVTQASTNAPTRRFTSMPDAVPYRYRVRARNADGWGPWSGFEGANIAPGQTHLRPYGTAAALVDAYLDDFGVALSPQQRGQWIVDLTVGDVATLGALAHTLATNSSRAAQAPVIRLYLAYFDRAPATSSVTNSGLPSARRVNWSTSEGSA